LKSKITNSSSKLTWKNQHRRHPVKPFVVASKHGDTVTAAEVDGKPVTIGLNAYIKR
jgi:hypothetical protein